MPDRDEMVRVVAAALREHQSEGPSCQCGWRPDWAAQPFVGWIAQYDAHQAAAVVDALSERLAQASSYEIREHEDGQDFPLDEVVARRPRLVHLERMSRTGWWLGIDMPDGTHIAVNLGAVNPVAKGYGHAEVEDPTTDDEETDR